MAPAANRAAIIVADMAGSDPVAPCGPSRLAWTGTGMAIAGMPQHSAAVAARAVSGPAVTIRSAC